MNQLLISDPFLFDAKSVREEEDDWLLFQKQQFESAWEQSLASNPGFHLDPEPKKKVLPPKPDFGLKTNWKTAPNFNKNKSRIFLIKLPVQSQEQVAAKLSSLETLASNTDAQSNQNLFGGGSISDSSLLTFLKSIQIGELGNQATATSSISSALVANTDGTFANISEVGNLPVAIVGPEPEISSPTVTSSESTALEPTLMDLLMDSPNWGDYCLDDAAWDQGSPDDKIAKMCYEDTDYLGTPAADSKVSEELQTTVMSTLLGDQYQQFSNFQLTDSSVNMADVMPPSAAEVDISTTNTTNGQSVATSRSQHQRKSTHSLRMVEHSPSPLSSQVEQVDNMQLETLNEVDMKPVLSHENSVTSPMGMQTRSGRNSTAAPVPSTSAKTTRKFSVSSAGGKRKRKYELEDNNDPSIKNAKAAKLNRDRKKREFEEMKNRAEEAESEVIELREKVKCLEAERNQFEKLYSEERCKNLKTEGMQLQFTNMKHVLEAIVPALSIKFARPMKVQVPDQFSRVPATIDGKGDIDINPVGFNILDESFQMKPEHTENLACGDGQSLLSQGTIDQQLSSSLPSSQELVLPSVSTGSSHENGKILVQINPSQGEIKLDYDPNLQYLA